LVQFLKATGLGSVQVGSAPEGADSVFNICPSVILNGDIFVFHMPLKDP
jgi:hypothetical protein